MRSDPGTAASTLYSPLIALCNRASARTSRSLFLLRVSPVAPLADSPAPPLLSTSMTTYWMDGDTATAVLPGSVQGVVVQANMNAGADESVNSEWSDDCAGTLAGSSRNLM